MRHGRPMNVWKQRLRMRQGMRGHVPPVHSRISFSIALFSVLVATVSAGRLDPGRWTFTGPAQELAARAADNDIATAWISPGAQTPGMGLTIDLGRPSVLHRVYVSSGPFKSMFARSMEVLVGDTTDTLHRVAGYECYAKGDGKLRPDGWLDWQTEGDFQFQPAVGRYVRVQIAANSAGFPWAIAEMEIYGTRKAVKSPEDWGAILVETNAPAALQLAARELSYYLGELSGLPFVIAAPDDRTRHGGPIFRLVTPPPEQLPYAERDPLWLEDVSVVRTNDEVQICGPTARAVLYGAYEFLERQGVRWVYPGAQGDFVPARGRLDFSVLPIHYRPSFATRSAMWSYADSPPVPNAKLWYIRNRANDTGGGAIPGLGGQPPWCNAGFGLTHTMANLIPWDVYNKHTEWRPGPYKKGWYQVPCTTDTNVVAYVVNRILEADKDKPAFQGYGIHPLDVPCWCECPRCQAVLGGAARKADIMPDNMAMGYDYSMLYYTFITNVAAQVGAKLPNKFIAALAYENHRYPPAGIESFPSNVNVRVCQYWKHNLPVNSPKNADQKAYMEQWASRVRTGLGVYDYVLIHMDGDSSWPVMAPLVTGMADQYRFLHDHGVRHMGSQASEQWQDDPWNYYAYLRLGWRVDQPAADILKEFFNCFYRESAGPMLAYYKTAEDYQVSNDIPLEGGAIFTAFFFSYVPTATAFPPPVLAAMERHLREAEQQATSWIVRERIGWARRSFDWTRTQVGL